MTTSFQAFMDAKKSGHLRSMKVSGYGAASVDSEKLIKSEKVGDNIKVLKKSFRKDRMRVK
ncbi:hypothetical protein [Halomonas salinarum]|uniref:hypothetical protein n=1 Tax=Halomonas salinarum TaxID=1158993 RepID=UPI00143B7F1B|nr:hypothetical protein [Halomonas salinarum]